MCVHMCVYVLLLLSAIIADHNICDYGFDIPDMYNHTVVVFVISSIVWKRCNKDPLCS